MMAQSLLGRPCAEKRILYLQVQLVLQASGRWCEKCSQSCFQVQDLRFQLQLPCREEVSRLLYLCCICYYLLSFLPFWDDRGCTPFVQSFFGYLFIIVCCVGSVCLIQGRLLLCVFVCTMWFCLPNSGALTIMCVCMAYYVCLYGLCLRCDIPGMSACKHFP